MTWNSVTNCCVVCNQTSTTSTNDDSPDPEIINNGKSVRVPSSSSKNNSNNLISTLRRCLDSNFDDFKGQTSWWAEDEDEEEEEESVIDIKQEEDSGNDEDHDMVTYSSCRSSSPSFSSSTYFCPGCAATLEEFKLLQREARLLQEKMQRVVTKVISIVLLTSSSSSSTNVNQTNNNNNVNRDPIQSNIRVLRNKVCTRFSPIVSLQQEKTGQEEICQEYEDDDDDVIFVDSPLPYSDDNNGDSTSKSKKKVPVYHPISSESSDSDFESDEEFSSSTYKKKRKKNKSGQKADNLVTSELVENFKTEEEAEDDVKIEESIDNFEAPKSPPPPTNSTTTTTTFSTTITSPSSTILPGLPQQRLKNVILVTNRYFNDGTSNTAKSSDGNPSQSQSPNQSTNNEKKQLFYVPITIFKPTPEQIEKLRQEQQEKQWQLLRTPTTRTVPKPKSFMGVEESRVIKHLGEGKFLYRGYLPFQVDPELNAFRCGVCQVVRKNQLAVQDHLSTKHKFYNNSNSDGDDEEISPASATSSNESTKRPWNCTVALGQGQFMVGGKWKFTQVPNPNADSQQLDCQAFTCETCQKVFQGQKSVVKHIKYSHIDSSTFMCEECAKVFQSKTALAQHKLTHSTHRRFICEQCGRGFTYGALLKSHQKHVHGTKDGFSCPVKDCEKIFKEKKELKVHVETHSGYRAHLCHECGQSYCSQPSLNTHIAIVHKKESRFQCPICQKRFYERSHYNRHMESPNVHNSNRKSWSVPKKFRKGNEDPETTNTDTDTNTQAKGKQQ